MRVLTFYSFLALSIFLMATSHAQMPGVARVVVLGVDGMGSDNLWRNPYNGVPAPQVPTMEALMARGAWTKYAKIDPRNFSGPNWNGMVTSSLSDDHGVTSNSCTQSSIETIYEVIRAQNSGAEIGAIFEWSPVGCYMADGVLDHKVDTGNETETADEVINYLTGTDVDFLFVHFDRVDGAGHGNGGHSQEYVDRMEAVDQQMGRIISALENAGQLDSTVIIITGDHGHHPTSGSHASEDHPVPFIVAGPSITAGEIVGSNFGDLRNNQVAAVTAHALGIDPSSEWTNTIGLWANAFTAPIPGCTDSTYEEYNPLATVDDNSCVTPKVTGMLSFDRHQSKGFIIRGQKIYFIEDIHLAELFGANGELISRNSFDLPTKELRVMDVKPGQYFLRYQTSQGSQWSNVVINLQVQK